MIARDEIIDALEASTALPAGSIAIVPYSRDIGVPQLPTVMVRVDEVRPGTTQGRWGVVAALILITPLTEPGPADDELEALLADVVYALDTEDVAQAMRWTVAQRATYKGSADDAPTFPAFEITVETNTTKE